MYATFGKRGFDLALGSIALATLAPIMALIATALRLTMGKPVIFRQERSGRYGRPFFILKFRTMHEARDSQNVPLSDSQRLTGLGKILRATSLDELPELLNVIKGDMSLVGPRPLVSRYYPHFTREELERFAVRPGITGAAQIAGRNDLSWDARIAADLAYVRSISFHLDLLILLKTALNVVTRKGVNVNPCGALEDFDVERSRRLASSTAPEP